MTTPQSAPMTPAAALDLLFTASTQAALTKQHHIMCEQALAILQKALEVPAAK